MDWQKKVEKLTNDGIALRVYQGEKIVFESKEPMLRPLFVCSRTMPKEMRHATVVDKVVGKAAAYVCIVSGVGQVLTPLASQSAVDALTESGIEIRAQKIVPAILNRDKTGPCPMETLAESAATPDEFYRELEQRIKIQ